VTNAGTLIFNRSGSFTVANGIAGTGTPNPASVMKLGSGTMTLGGVNSYEGNTYVSNGVVKLGASEVIPDGGITTGWLILDGGPTAAGTLDLNGNDQSLARVIDTGKITPNGGTLTLGAGSAPAGPSMRSDRTGKPLAWSGSILRRSPSGWTNCRTVRSSLTSSPRPGRHWRPRA
jgi:autotransporter-associated beta strand protein